MARKRKRNGTPQSDDLDLAIGITPRSRSNTITARRAGGIVDLKLCVSPVETRLPVALRNMAKALNLALKADYIETPLDEVYKGARVREGTVQILHREYIGLGDGILASLGKTAKSFSLTLKGPDAASPEGRSWLEQHQAGALSGVLNLIGRKLNLLQEFEDQVPVYVEQTLDRLEAKQVVVQWHRNQWDISTTLIGLDVILCPTKASSG